jgi:diadenosine tetraphosphate (Ap4A) HIT family hydrolase
LPDERILDRNAHALAIPDLFPVSVGHTLVIPRRHVASYFDLTAAEAAAVHELLQRTKDRLERTLGTDAYNIGVNIGSTAGQTVFHVHIHLIPRYPGDVADAVGGVRNIIPGRGRYPGSLNEGAG